MAKRGRKKRDRKHSKANHGKRPNCGSNVGALAPTDDRGAADLDAQPLAQPIGRLLTAALLRDQSLDPLLDAVVAEARRAFFEMVLELVPGLGRALAVEKRPYLRDHSRAFGVVGVDGSDRRADQRVDRRS